MPNTSNITVIDHEYIAQSEARDKSALSIEKVRMVVIALALTTVATFIAGAISAL